MKKFNIAILGFGFMGKVYNYASKIINNYYPNTPELVNNHLLVSERKNDADIDSIKKRYGIKNVTSDINDLLKNDEIDAFYIATPNNLHFQQVKQILEHDKHILCDKPIATSLNESKQMLDLAN